MVYFQNIAQNVAILLTSMKKFQQTQSCINARTHCVAEPIKPTRLDTFLEIAQSVDMFWKNLRLKVSQNIGSSGLTLTKALTSQNLNLYISAD